MINKSRLKLDIYSKESVIIMKCLKTNKKLLSVLLIPLGIILTNIAKHNPQIVEKVYSTGFYKTVTYILSNITGIVPYSVAEFLLYALFIFIVVKIILSIVRIKNSKEYRLKAIIYFLQNILITISLLYFCFLLVWGLNYYRLPFSRIAKLDTKPASLSELENLCTDLIKRANKLKDESIKQSYNNTANMSRYDMDVLNRAYKGYDNVSAIYPELEGKYGKPKKVLSSTAMSYLGISGIYFPYTAEANVNTNIPDIMLPNTASHEMAHQRGFAREDEANYIAYVTCTMHPDIDFQYSGTLLALIHSSNALYRNDKERYKKIKKLYSEEVIKDLAEINEFWKQYQGPIEKASTKINNAYLKANNQKDGVKSYGRMVDLLIAEHKRKIHSRQ
ncbi:hypothetical protein HNR33_000294 [Brassicibacter mesophilus]